MIESKNDGKGKYQSWESNIIDDSGDGMGHFNANFTGYGETESESKENVIQQVENLIKRLKRVRDEL